MIIKQLSLSVFLKSDTEKNNSLFFVKKTTIIIKQLSVGCVESNTEKKIISINFFYKKMT
jgi:hypothetical protein